MYNVNINHLPHRHVHHSSTLEKILRTICTLWWKASSWAIESTKREMKIILNEWFAMWCSLVKLYNIFFLYGLQPKIDNIHKCSPTSTHIRWKVNHSSTGSFPFHVEPYFSNDTWPVLVCVFLYCIADSGDVVMHVAECMHMDSSTTYTMTVCTAACTCIIATTFVHLHYSSAYGIVRCAVD